MTGGTPVIPVHRVHRHDSEVAGPHLGDQYHVNVRQLGTSPEAIGHYEKALAELQAGDTDRAIRHLKHAIEIAPAFLEAVYRLSEVFYEKERYSDAQQLLQQTLMVTPSEQRLHLVLDKVFVREHKFTEAVAEVDAYLQSDAAGTDRPMLEKLRAKLVRHIPAP